MNSTYEWLLGFFIASIGFGPWLLHFYLQSKRLTAKAATTISLVVPAAPAWRRCLYTLTDGRRCMEGANHEGRHTVGAPRQRCDNTAVVMALDLVISCERPEGHFGPHCGVDDKGLLRLFSFQDRQHGFLSDPILEVPPIAPSSRSTDLPPHKTPEPEPALVPDAPPSENPPSDP